MQLNRLIQSFGDRARSRLTLYCFPYGGGSASAYFPWQQALGETIDVCAIQLPGRGNRLGEPLHDSVHAMAVEAVESLSKDSKKPYAFFGHSMGGLIAYEVSRQISVTGQQGPVALFVSACAPPQHRGEIRNLHLLPDIELVDALREYEGTPSEILENAELMSLVLPALRADFGAVSRYEWKPAGSRLSMPVSVHAGCTDQHIEAESLVQWREETSGSLEVHWYQGGHFYLNDCQDELLDRILMHPAVAVHL